MELAGLLTAIVTIIGMVLGWYFDKDRLRGKALNVKKEEGKEAQLEIDYAAAKKDYETLSIIMQRLHDSRRGLSVDETKASGSDKQ